MAARRKKPSAIGIAVKDAGRSDWRYCASRVDVRRRPSQLTPYYYGLPRQLLSPFDFCGRRAAIMAVNSGPWPGVW